MFSITSLITKSLGVIFDFLVYVIIFGKHRFRSSSKVAAVKTDSSTEAEDVFEKELPEMFAKDKNKNLFDHGDKTRVVVPTFRFFPYVCFVQMFFSYSYSGIHALFIPA